ncbi:hypothetical protein [Bacillus sp. AK031]
MKGAIILTHITAEYLVHGPTNNLEKKAESNALGLRLVHGQSKKLWRDNLR